MSRQLDIYMQRLDVLCSVIDSQVLQPGSRRVAKHDIKLLRDAAQKVVVEYLKEVNKNG